MRGCAWQLNGEPFLFLRVDAWITPALRGFWK
jgi:hypothetical protein